jgi:DNA replication protein
MTYYEQYKTNLVLPQAFLTHLLAIFPTLSSFNVWLYFYQDEALAPSQVAAFLKLTTADVNQDIALLTEAAALIAEFDEKTGDMRFDTRPAFAKLDKILSDATEELSNTDEPEQSDIARLIAAFEPEMAGGLTPINIEELQKWLTDDQYAVDLILQALREAALNRKVSLPYIRAILRNWRKDGVVTLNDVTAHQEARDSRQSETAPTAPLTEEYFDSVDSLRKSWGYDHAE